MQTIWFIFLIKIIILYKKYACSNFFPTKSKLKPSLIWDENTHKSSYRFFWIKLNLAYEISMKITIFRSKFGLVERNSDFFHQFFQIACSGTGAETGDTSRTVANSVFHVSFFFFLSIFFYFHSIFITLFFLPREFFFLSIEIIFFLFYFSFYFLCIDFFLWKKNVTINTPIIFFISNGRRHRNVNLFVVVSKQFACVYKHAVWARGIKLAFFQNKWKSVNTIGNGLLGVSLTTTFRLFATFLCLNRI